MPPTFSYIPSSHPKRQPLYCVFTKEYSTDSYSYACTHIFSLHHFLMEMEIHPSNILLFSLNIVSWRSIILIHSIDLPKLFYQLKTRLCFSFVFAITVSQSSSECSKYTLFCMNMGTFVRKITKKWNH